MYLLGNYSYRVTSESFCENRPLPCNHPLRLVFHLRCTPHDDDLKIMFTASTLVPHDPLLSEDTAGALVSPVIASMGIPARYQAPIIQDISSISRSLMSFLETCPSCHRFLVPGIVFAIRVEKIIAAEDDKVHDLRWAMEHFNIQVERMLISTESPIEALEIESADS